MVFETPPYPILVEIPLFKKVASHSPTYVPHFSPDRPLGSDRYYLEVLGYQISYRNSNLQFLFPGGMYGCRLARGDINLTYIIIICFILIILCNCWMLHSESLPGIQVSYAAVLDASFFCFLTSPSQRLLL